MMPARPQRLTVFSEFVHVATFHGARRREFFESGEQGRTKLNLKVFRGGRVATPGYGCKTPPSRLVPSPRSLAIALRAFGLLVGSVFGSPGYELAGLWSAPTKGRLG